MHYTYLLCWPRCCSLICQWRVLHWRQDTLFPRVLHELKGITVWFRLTMQGLRTGHGYIFNWRSTHVLNRPETPLVSCCPWQWSGFLPMGGNQVQQCPRTQCVYMKYLKIFLFWINITESIWGWKLNLQDKIICLMRDQNSLSLL